MVMSKDELTTIVFLAILSNRQDKLNKKKVKKMKRGVKQCKEDAEVVVNTLIKYMQ